MAALTAQFLGAPAKRGRHEVAEITFVTEGSRRIRVWRPVSGASFLSIDEKDGVLHEHFAIVLTDPDASNRVITVNLSTLRFPWTEDTSCVVDVDEVGPALRARSYAFYAKAERRCADTLSYGIARNILRPKGPVSGNLLMRVRKGFLASPRADQDMAADVRRALSAWSAT